MPPKPKFTRDEIIDAAYALIKAEGADAVVARRVAKALGTTVSPIFTVFSGMDELKRAVWEKAKNECVACLGEAAHYTPAFKEFGLRFIRYAKDEPFLFRFLFADSIDRNDPQNLLQTAFSDIFEPMIDEIRVSFGLSFPDAEDVFNQMIIHGCGIAFFLSADTELFPDDTVGRLISEACISLVTLKKIAAGDAAPDSIRPMMAALSRMPVRRA